MTSQEGSSLLKSCVRRSFSFTCGNLQAFATHPHSLGDPLLGPDPWFEKHCVRFMVCKRFVTKNAINMVSLFDIMVSQQFKSKMLL